MLSESIASYLCYLMLTCTHSNDATHSSRYKTGSYAIDGPFLCKAKFEGTSVIDGVKQLVPAGAAVLPLPPHLAELHSTAKSNFVLKDAVAE